MDGQTEANRQRSDGRAQTLGVGEEHHFGPMADMIVDGARDAISTIVPAGTTVDVRLVWDPPWTPDKMTGIAREHFGWPG